MELKSRKRIRIVGKCLFVLYVGFLLYFLLITEWYGRTEIRTEYAYNLELFREIKRFWTYRETLGTVVVLANLVGNVVVFAPLGFILPVASKHKSFLSVIVYSFLLSLSIECVQLVTKVGSFDVDDLMLNTMGGCIGYVAFVICCRIRRKYVSKKTKKR